MELQVFVLKVIQDVESRQVQCVLLGNQEISSVVCYLSQVVPL